MGLLSSVDWTAVAAIATLLAVVAAFATPYLAARIERRRRRVTAVRLAELAVRAIDLIASLQRAMLQYQASGDDYVPLPDAEESAARSLDLPALLARMEALPSADIDDADALEAFIRIVGLVRTAQAVSVAVGELVPVVPVPRPPSVDKAVAADVVKLLDEYLVLRAQAATQLRTLKARLAA